MIRTEDGRQLTFVLLFGGGLRPKNRWVELSACVPWEELEPSYNAVMDMDQGRPCNPARLMIGAIIIKHKLNLSDEETVLQIQENAYLQYFCDFETSIDVNRPGFIGGIFV